MTARIYDDDAPHGYRVLVDRLWPRGISKDQAALDEWCKDVAPSTELRQWFHGKGSHAFDEFAQRYRAELDDRPEVIDHLRHLGDQKSVVVFLYGIRDTEHNHAAVLVDYLDGQ